MLINTRLKMQEFHLHGLIHFNFLLILNRKLLSIQFNKLGTIPSKRIMLIKKTESHTLI